MYLLLNGGQHPFFLKGDTSKSYTAKLGSLKQEDVKLDGKFS